MFLALKEFIKLSQEGTGSEFVEIYLKTSPECKEIFALYNIDGSRPEPEKVFNKCLFIFKIRLLYLHSLFSNRISKTAHMFCGPFLT